MYKNKVSNVKAVLTPEEYQEYSEICKMLKITKVKQTTALVRKFIKKNKHLKTVTSILIFAICLNTFGQKEDVKYAASNIISGGIISSAIACFNKPKGQKLGKTFVNSFWKGCLGGSINYASKKLIEQSALHNTYSYAWPARLVHSAGTSIITNGARNEKLFSSFEMDVYFTHLRYDGRVHCQIDPITLTSAGYFLFAKNFVFNPKVSVLTGSIVFDKKSDDFIVDNGDIGYFRTSGQSYGNTIWRKVCKQYFYTFTTRTEIIDGQTYYPTSVNRSIITWDKQIICHELVHTFQYSEYNVFNDLYINKLNFKLLKSINLNANFAGMYLIYDIKGYDNNHFENEANYFGQSNYFFINSNKN